MSISTQHFRGLRRIRSGKRFSRAIHQIVRKECSSPRETSRLLPSNPRPRLRPACAVLTPWWHRFDRAQGLWDNRERKGTCGSIAVLAAPTALNVRLTEVFDVIIYKCICAERESVRGSRNEWLPTLLPEVARKRQKEAKTAPSRLLGIPSASHHGVSGDGLSWKLPPRMMM